MHLRWIVLLITLAVTATHASDLPEVCEQGTWVGPMHPHIRGEEGDRCPVCGMDLVPDPACFPDDDTTASPDGEREVLYWHDPMVPDVKFDEPGPSPFMDMDLVPVYADETNTNDPGTVQISARFEQALGVRTAPVQTHTLGQTVRALGDVVANTRNEWMLHMRTEGWVVDLATSAVGDDVKQGQVLFRYYSPALLDAQTDFLVSERSDRARERLTLFGMSEQAIKDLKNNGEVMRQTPFYAPMDGTVVTLPIREGSLLKAGDLALAVQDFSSVWVNADVRLQDLAGIAVGQPAQVVAPQTGQRWAGVVDFIHPVANPDTRRATVRLAVEQTTPPPSAPDQPAPALRPGAYVDVVFDTQPQPRLAVPMEAVLYDAQGATVIESLGQGQYRPTRVETGITSQGLTEITSGLDADQQIVTSGQFMIDADSSLRSGMDQMAPPDTAATEDHSEMDHSEMDHSEMDHSEMDHSEMDHSEMDHLRWITLRWIILRWITPR
jgi:Cu(I)/Ag(I) efflux system membrane fusion protein